MSDGHRDAGQPELDVAVESALGSVQSPRARGEFRARLRRRFLADETVTTPSPASRREPRLWLRVGGLVAAGVLIVLGYVALRGGAPAWQVLDLAEGSVIRADGVRITVEDRALLARTLGRAAEIEVERGDLVLRLGDVALFDLGEGTRASFGPPAELAAAESFELRASAGRLRGRTGPGFRGRRMHVSADVMDLVVTGTAFAVDYEVEGTCVCCLHGEVEVTSNTLGPGSQPVPEGRMCLVYRSEREPEWGGPPDSHAAPLLRLEERARALGW